MKVEEPTRGASVNATKNPLLHIGPSRWAGIGFRSGGWMTGGSAEAMANKRADIAVTAALLPVCLTQSKADPNGVTKLAEFRAIASSYAQHEYLVKSGWATFPGSETANSDMATACANA
jgi:hypothetical protein